MTTSRLDDLCVLQNVQDDSRPDSVVFVLNVCSVERISMCQNTEDDECSMSSWKLDGALQRQNEKLLHCW